jgi:hypothetical protein
MNPDEAETHMGNRLRAVQIDARRIFEECNQQMQHAPMVMLLEVVPPVSHS